MYSLFWISVSFRLLFFFLTLITFGQFCLALPFWVIFYGQTYFIILINVEHLHLQQLIDNLDRDLQYAIKVEGKMDLDIVSNYDEVKGAIKEKVRALPYYASSYQGCFIHFKNFVSFTLLTSCVMLIVMIFHFKLMSMLAISFCACSVHFHRLFDLYFQDKTCRFHYKIIHWFLWFAAC